MRRSRSTSEPPKQYSAALDLALHIHIRGSNELTSSNVKFQRHTLERNIDNLDASSIICGVITDVNGLVDAIYVNNRRHWLSLSGRRCLYGRLINQKDPAHQPVPYVYAWNSTWFAILNMDFISMSPMEILDLAKPCKDYEEVGPPCAVSGATNET